MEFFKQNKKAKAELNSGFGTNATSYGGRFVNKDGSANIRKRGLSFFDRISWYHTMLDMPTWKFLSILFGFYFAINLVFATLYYLIGIEYLNGIDNNGSEWLKFGKAYFFSAQTFTTVGYGHISPNGFATSTLAAAEALVGLLSFSIATGLFFGRFSRPRAYIKFSDCAVIAPYRGGTALMLRLVPFKNTNLTDAYVKITLGMVVEEDGKKVNKFYQLPLEMQHVNLLTLSWTVVHPITEESPLYQFTAADFAKIEGEILVFIKAFDEMFCTTVAANSSYLFTEIKYGAKFNMMYFDAPDDTITILELDKLNDVTEVELPN
ncbi:ion channel [Flavobacterium sp.]|uniref:ion channel n=1 Tax=Flavobacterium sp. TaxID=239 RepID=UPI003B9BD3C6